MFCSLYIAVSERVRHGCTCGINGLYLLRGLDGLRVVAHREEDGALTDISLNYTDPRTSIERNDDITQTRRTELRINLDRFLRILQCLGERRQLGVTRRAIVICARIAWVALNALRVRLHSRREVVLLEQYVTLLARLVAQLGVYIRGAVGLGFEPLDVTKLVEDIRGAVLRERLVIELDRGSMVAFLGVRRSLAP